jgi:hypothetical protein
MIEHVTELLGTYLDGELRGLRLHQVEEHLSRCKACRKELEELRSLSTLLQETVPAEAFTPTERFVSNLALSLPRRSETRPARKPLEFIWWLVPAGVLGAWIFLQTVFTVSTVVSTADLTGLLGNATAWLQNGSQQTVWFSASMSMFGSHINGNQRSLLDVLNGLSVFGSSIALQAVLQGGIGLLLGTWLAFWWSRQRAGSQPGSAQISSHS